MIILLISLVPAPISYSLASRRRRPVAYSFTYPLPPKHCMACKVQNDINAISPNMYMFFRISTISITCRSAVWNSLSHMVEDFQCLYRFQNAQSSFFMRTICVNKLDGEKDLWIFHLQSDLGGSFSCTEYNSCTILKQNEKNITIISSTSMICYHWTVAKQLNTFSEEIKNGTKRAQNSQDTLGSILPLSQSLATE